MVSANQVAKFLLSLACEGDGDFITPLKLQKLLYYCQGFHLAVYDRPLFKEEIQRWEHGPVVPQVYRAYKHLGNGPIECPDAVNPSALTVSQQELINEVYKVYGAYSASALRNMTHAEPPWLSAEDGCAISHDSLSEYFKTRLVVGG